MRLLHDGVAKFRNIFFVVVRLAKNILSYSISLKDLDGKDARDDHIGLWVYLYPMQNF